MSRDTNPMQFLSAQADPAATLQPRGSLGDVVYEALLSRLISLAIAPGNRIAVDALVRELGVSQTPIRAALIRLESEGLVVKTHNVGYSAAPLPSPQRFAEIYEMRLLLEPHAAARAAATLTPETLAELEAIADTMARPQADVASLAYGKFAMHDANFHDWIAAHSGNDLIAEALSRLYAHTHLFRLRFHTHVTEDAVLEHAAIMAALKKGDPQAAHDAMKEHILRSRNRMDPFLAERR